MNKTSTPKKTSSESTTVKAWPASNGKGKKHLSPSETSLQIIREYSRKTSPHSKQDKN